MALRVRSSTRRSSVPGVILRGFSVSGPAVVFGKDLRRMLALAGLRQMPGAAANGAITWAMKPTHAYPPVHLIRSLSHLADFRPDAEVSRLLSAAEGPNLRDRAGPLFAAGGSAGDAPLRVTAIGDQLVANCSSSFSARRGMLEAAGWGPISPDPSTSRGEKIIAAFGDQPWICRESILAQNLQPWMDASATAKLVEMIAADRERASKSRREKPEGDFEIPRPEGLEFDFFDFQKSNVQAIVEEGKNALIADDMGLGKALSVDTPVLTPEGWVPIGEIEVGDLVIGSAGTPVRVIGAYPQGELDLFEVTFTDGVSVKCCDEHLWAVSSMKAGSDEPLKEILPLSAIRSDLTRQDGSPRYRIPLIEPVRFGPRQLRSPRATGFIAASDGRSRLRFMRANIPGEYLLGSEAQRLDLLRGLMDAKGKVGNDGCISFSSYSRGVADSVMSVVRSLGGTASVKKDLRQSGMTLYTISILLPKGVRPFYIERKHKAYERAARAPFREIVSVTPVGRGEAKCIAVDSPDRLFATEGFVLTHNTVQAIAVLTMRPDLRRGVIFCKANMKDKWKREVEKWLARDPMPTIGVARGDDFPDTDIVIINYDIAERHAAKLRARVQDFMIMDESQSVSNDEAQRTVAIYGDLRSEAPQGIRIRKANPSTGGKPGIKLDLTGTPNPLIERTWSTVSTLRPDLFGRGESARLRFIDRYAPPRLIRKEFQVKNGRGQVVRTYERTIPLPGDPIRDAELQIRMRNAGMVFRHLKADLVASGQLPPKMRHAIELPFRFTEAETAEMKAAEGDILSVIEGVSMRAAGAAGVRRNEGEAKPVIDIVSGLSRQSPEFQEIARLRARIGLIKAPYVADMILDRIADDSDDLPPEMRNKHVIFAHHKPVIAAIRERIEARMPGSVVVYDGSVSDRRKQGLVDSFQEDESKRVFLMSLTGASGITLTRSCLLTMAEMDWDPLNVAQIEDRIWRIGQMKPCDIGYAFVPDSLDLTVGNAVIRKMHVLMDRYDRIDLSGGVTSEKRIRMEEVSP